MTDIDKLQENGVKLYNNILETKHNGNIEEMFDYFKKNVERIDLYGDTIEKKMLNYCSYRPELVMYMYRKYVYSSKLSSKKKVVIK